ncbi:MAG: [acyl-carrier-protein] S-malonyltransferase [Dehalococcoidia bacterium]|nr:[acyl-carrier-protein] S-malonyltransferase [Dehalococcoidia bacterium]
MDYVNDKNSTPGDGTPKIAFLFPGQGTQQVSMGRDLAAASPAARRVFEEVDDALGLHLSRLVFEGPEQNLRLTSNAQPAILATSVAALRALEETVPPHSRLKPSALAGHSLGEFTALVAAGALKLGDAARLVRARGEAMQHASGIRPGGMAAILGLDELTVEEVCQETGVQIANINASDQIVIAGDRLALARTLDLLTARGATRTITLPVSGAFHSRLMGPALGEFLSALDAADIRTPSAPVIANVSARPISTPQEIRDALRKQLVGCVQWHQSMLCLQKMGIAQAYEFGPGRVLTNLLKRIVPDVRTFNISDVQTLQATAG